MASCGEEMEAGQSSVRSGGSLILSIGHGLVVSGSNVSGCGTIRTSRSLHTRWIRGLRSILTLTAEKKGSLLLVTGRGLLMVHSLFLVLMLSYWCEDRHRDLL